MISRQHVYDLSAAGIRTIGGNMGKVSRRAIALASGAALSLVLATSPAAASSGSQVSATGNAWGKFNDDGDIVSVCDRHPNNGVGARAQIAVQQADGSYLSKEPITVWYGNCASVHQDVLREAAPVMLTVCDVIPSRGGTAYCQQSWFY